MSPAADAVIERLDAARQRWWLFSLMTSCVLTGCASLGLLLVFMLTDALLKFSQVWLVLMFVVWTSATIALIVVVCRRLIRSQRTLEGTARRVEAEMPELGSNLINLLQLIQPVDMENRAFRMAAVNEATARIGSRRFEGAADHETRWRRFRYAMQTPRDFGESVGLLGTLLAIAILCHLFIPNWGSAASRLMTPWEFVPSVGSTGDIAVTPGDTEVLVGCSLEIAGVIENPEAIPQKATLFVMPKDEEESALPMTADEKRQRYSLTLPSVLKPLQYRLEIGDSQSRVFTVGLREKPTIAEVEVTIYAPTYLGGKSETFMQKTADLQALQFSEAQLRIQPSVSVASGHLQIGSVKVPLDVGQNGMMLVSKRFPLLEDGSFTVHLTNSAGHTDPNPRVNRIRVIQDGSPTVQLLKPPRQSSNAPGGEVPVVIRAGDDHGVAQLLLELKVKDAAPEEETAEGEAAESRAAAREDRAPAKIVKRWAKLESGTAITRQHVLELSKDIVEPGQTVLVRAVAWDQRAMPGWGLPPEVQKKGKAATGWHSIRVVAEEAKTSAALEQLDSLRAAIWKVLEKQIRARVRTACIAKASQVADRASLATNVREQQIDIQKATIELVQGIGKTEQSERVIIKRILNKLAFGDMLRAVQQCDDLLKLQAADAFEKPVADLGETQDRVVDTLRKLLDVARQAQSEALSEAKKRSNGDMPDDVKSKLEEARKKIDEFLAEQKKVIEASENLAKKPVEDFTEEDEELLKEMAANQDDWSKMMKDLHSDLSKLPDQDFANSSMLKELVEIQTELKMAEDALLKKTADIAVPLEQLGAEMAEEIKTNIEKWLPDEPDRKRWSQEEYLTDELKEAPMTELPGELEDLIGELLEEEEDLFDEMEDVSSSAADSLDKGAGWDATDGPISNMSAKGVTGNTLPNTSEMGGRSGEGRSGKSSGEFVGDEAVGKGGRKTPSRLTPDPYMKGQIKDHSKDGQGGATGGGKESGQGGEGLEGPAPQNKGKRDLQRLAGKQAALRNKAEGVDAQFQVMNYHHTDLEKMIELMTQIERDLKSGRYENAMRQRKVLADGLSNVKQYLEGEFEVGQDATANLPGEIQKELLGSMQDPSPAGWEELNRKYFERLSAGGGAAE